MIDRNGRTGTATTRVPSARWHSALRALRRLVALAATPHEVLRSLRSSDIARGYPRYWRWLLRLALAEIVVLLVAAIWLPRVALVVLAAIALGAGISFWRARPSWGRGKAWPPGSVGLGSQAMADPDFFFKRWRKYGSIFKANLFDRPMVCVVGVREISELFHEHGHALAPTVSPWNRYIPGNLVRWMQGNLHDRYRAHLARSLSDPFIEANRACITRGVESGIEKMADDDSETGLAPLPYIQELIFLIWAELFFGLVPSDARFAEFQAGYETISIEKQESTRRVRAAIQLLQETITSRSRDVTPVPRTTLLSEMIRLDEGALENPITTINLIYLMETTSLDVSGLLMWVFKHAVDHPRYLLALRRESNGRLALANRMVSETVRLEQSEYLHRRAIEDIRFRGVVIPKGWLIHGCIHESHRDPTVFENPDLFDPDRFLRHHYARDFAPFGLDGRSCLGVALARAVCVEFLITLATRYRVSKTGDGRRELSAQRHWAPSSEFRVSLSHVDHIAERVGQK